MEWDGRREVDGGDGFFWLFRLRGSTNRPMALGEWGDSQPPADNSPPPPPPRHRPSTVRWGRAGAHTAHLVSVAPGRPLHRLHLQRSSASFGLSAALTEVGEGVSSTEAAHLQHRLQRRSPHSARLTRQSEVQVQWRIHFISSFRYRVAPL